MSLAWTVFLIFFIIGFVRGMSWFVVTFSPGGGEPAVPPWEAKYKEEQEDQRPPRPRAQPKFRVIQGGKKDKEAV